MEAEKSKRNPLVDMSGGNQEGVLDGLMEALKTGSAFRDPSRPARKKKERKGKGLVPILGMLMLILCKICLAWDERKRGGGGGGGGGGG